MARKLALKRLTASDLTVFRWHFINRPAGNQKAINLDSQVLVGKLYPELARAGLGAPPRFKLDLKISGPGAGMPQTVVRKILKQQKNWRLNGEFIVGPVDDPLRYNDLAPDDFALFDFQGEQVPESVHILLVSAANPQDEGLHRELLRKYPDGSMRALDEVAIQELLEQSGLNALHPLNEWAEGELLEGAALGSAAAVKTINDRRRGRGLTLEELMVARKRAEAVGLSGEMFLNEWLLDKLREGSLAEVEWTSSTNAIAPYDFEIALSDADVIRRMDAKTTSGAFENPIHLSRAELREAVMGKVPYDIYRLYKLDERGAEMRAAYGVGPHLAEAFTLINSLPDGISVDSISIDPRILPFKEEVFFVGNPDFDGPDLLD